MTEDVVDLVQEILLALAFSEGDLLEGDSVELGGSLSRVQEVGFTVFVQGLLVGLVFEEMAELVLKTLHLLLLHSII